MATPRITANKSTETTNPSGEPSPLSNHSNTKAVWMICGKVCSKDALTYLSRMIVLYIITIVSCLNLTLGKGPQEIWITLISVSLGGLGISLLQHILPMKGGIKTSASSLNASVV